MDLREVLQVELSLNYRSDIRDLDQWKKWIGRDDLSMKSLMTENNEVKSRDG